MERSMHGFRKPIPRTESGANPEGEIAERGQHAETTCLACLIRFPTRYYTFVPRFTTITIHYTPPIVLLQLAMLALKRGQFV